MYAETLLSMLPAVSFTTAKTGPDSRYIPIINYSNVQFPYVCRTCSFQGQQLIFDSG